MIRRWIERIVLQVFEARITHNQPSEGVRNQPIMGSPLVVVHKLSNGYLLVTNNNGFHPCDSQVLVFCEDIGSIGAQIIAMEARVRMGVPSHVKVSASGGGGGSIGVSTLSNPVTQQHQYP
jgi:hypothetical protein